MKIKHILMAMTLMVAGNAAAQKLLTLEDVMWSGSNYYNLMPENKYTAWWGNQAVETTADEVRDLKTGKTIVTVEQVNKCFPEKIAFSGHNFSFPLPKEPVVMLTKGQRRAMLNFRTGQVLLDVTLPKDAVARDFNVKSKQTAYTIGGNLYILTPKGESLTVSSDGSTDDSENIVYGTSVHRDEFGISKGTFWSPDGTKLAFYRMDQSMVPSYPQVDITKRIAETYADHYPMAGETSPQVTVGIYDTATQKTTWMKLVGEKDDYHTNISWAPDGKTLYIFELNRDQNDCRLVAYDAETGDNLGTLYQETNEKYVEPQHGLTFLPWDNQKAVMQSQRDGWNHLYLFDVKTKELTQLTQGQWVVQEMVGFNTKKKSIIFLGNASDPRRRSAYAVDMKGKTTLLGEADGVHSVKLSEDGTQLLDHYTSPTTPRSINLVNTTNGKTENLLTATDKWAEQGYKIPEITGGSITAADGKTPLYYRMVKPIDFDPTKKYPTVVYVYGGPHAQMIHNSWNYDIRGWDIYMAQKGYVVFTVDNRGSSNRGLAFENCTFRQLGVEEMKDQLQGVEFLMNLPYVDADRLGVHGWSFGGFMTTNLLLTYPDVFKVGVAGGPVTDWKYYEVMYGERYMDTPQSNPEGYKNSSLLEKAGNLKGRLLVIHGGNDPVCVPQMTYSFLKACIDKGTHPDLFIYPGHGHNMTGRDRVHLHEHITRYFEDFLK